MYIYLYYIFVDIILKLRRYQYISDLEKAELKLRLADSISTYTV